VEGATSSQVLVLEKLDLLKQNLETCGETLTEAANWSALVRNNPDTLPFVHKLLEISNHDVL
jgi:hypothetical protein